MRLPRVLLALLMVLDVLLPVGSNAAALTHPGVLLSLPILESMRADVQARRQPRYGAFVAACASPFGLLNYTATPHVSVECGPGSRPSVGCGDERHDATAAYTHSLLWFIKQDARHAEKAIEIMDAWSAVVRSVASVPAHVAAPRPRSRRTRSEVFLGMPTL